MNFLKNNKKHLIALSFVLMLFAALLIVGCEKEEMDTAQKAVQVDDNANADAISNKTINRIELPKGYETLAPDEVKSYLNGLSEDELAILGEHGRITDYLKSIDLKDRAWLELKKGETFLDYDLSLLLNEAQMEELKHHKVSAKGNEKSNGSTPILPSIQGCIYTGYIYKECNCRRTCSDGCEWYCYKYYIYDCGSYNEFVLYEEYWSGTACNGCNNSAFITTDPQTYAKMSLFFSQEVKGEARELMNVFIEHSVEMNRILSTDDSKYRKVQLAFEELKIAFAPLVNEGFNNDKVVMDAAHIKAAITFLQELKLVAEAEELKKAANKVLDNIENTKGLSLKDAILKFDDPNFNK